MQGETGPTGPQGPTGPAGSGGGNSQVLESFSGDTQDLNNWDVVNRFSEGEDGSLELRYPFENTSSKQLRITEHFAVDNSWVDGDSNLNLRFTIPSSLVRRYFHLEDSDPTYLFKIKDMFGIDFDEAYDAGNDMTYYFIKNFGATYVDPNNPSNYIAVRFGYCPNGDYYNDEYVLSIALMEYVDGVLDWADIACIDDAEAQRGCERADSLSQYTFRFDYSGGGTGLANVLELELSVTPTDPEDETNYLSLDNLKVENNPYMVVKSDEIKSIKKITKSDYDALDPDYDENTLYIVVDDPEEPEEPSE